MWYAYWILFIDISLLEALKYDGYNTSHTYPTPKLPCCDAQFLMLSAVAVGQKIAQPRWVEAPLCRPGVDSLRRESGQTLWLGKLPVVVTGILALQRRRVSRKASENLWISLLQQSAEKLEDICEHWKTLDVNATKFQIDQLLGSIALDPRFVIPRLLPSDFRMFQSMLFVPLRSKKRKLQKHPNFYGPQKLAFHQALISKNGLRTSYSCVVLVVFGVFGRGGTGPSN